MLAPPFNLTADQRGRARKVGAHVDIGAFELQAPAPVFTGLQRVGTSMVLSFLTEVGHHYRVERTDVLVPAAWTTVADNLLGTGTTVQVTDSDGATHPTRFYRGQLLP